MNSIFQKSSLILAALILSACASSGFLNTGADPTSDISSQDMMGSQGSDAGEAEGLTSVRFGYDKAGLNASAEDALSQNAEWMKSNAEVRIQIEGHCDSRGSLEYNFSLGERRARAVKNYLVSLGVNPSQLTTISYGKEKLLRHGEDSEDHVVNRRANFLPIK